MQKFAYKSVAVAVLFAGCVSAQAAHLEYVGHLGFGGFSGASEGNYFNADLDDLSAGADVTLFGADAGYVTSYAQGQLGFNYAADAFYSNGSLNLSFSHGVDVASNGAISVGSHQQDVLVSLPDLTLRVMGDGEADGTPVQVSFAGMAHALNAMHPGVVSYTQMDIAVFNNGSQIGSFLWDASGLNAFDAFGFSFLTSVGAEFSLSATLAGGASIASLELTDAGMHALHAGAAMLSGDFTVTAVPEPEQYAMFLAGLGVIGAIARRRRFA